MAGFNFTTAIVDSGAAPKNCLEGTAEPAARLAINVPCPVSSFVGTSEAEAFEASALLIESFVYSEPYKKTVRRDAGLYRLIPDCCDTSRTIQVSKYGISIIDATVYKTN